METFTPFSSLAGGALIGLAASVLLLVNGRVAGISGVLGETLRGNGLRGEGAFRGAFLAGLFLSGLGMRLLYPAAFPSLPVASSGTSHVLLFAVTAAAGLFVGYGTRLGGGCTSGHGVCGLSRFSKRSLAATLTFMAAGAATVFVVRHVLGVAL